MDFHWACRRSCSQTIPSGFLTPLDVLDSRLLPPGLGPEPPKSGPGGGQNRAPRALVKLIFSWEGSTDWSPDRQAEVWDHFGHPQGVQVKTASVRFYSMLRNSASGPEIGFSGPDFDRISNAETSKSALRSVAGPILKLSCFVRAPRSVHPPRLALLSFQCSQKGFSGQTLGRIT